MSESEGGSIPPVPLIKLFGYYYVEELTIGKPNSLLESHGCFTHGLSCIQCTSPELCIIRPHLYQCDNPPTTSNEFATPLPLVPLPGFQSYSGSYSYFLRLAIRNRTLTHATFWDIPRSTGTDRRDILVHRLANALAQASQLELKLCILGDAFGAEVIPALARVLPHLRTLEIGPVLQAPSRLHPNVATAISSCLSHLPFLTTLNLNNSADLLDPSRPPAEGGFAQQDAAMLAAWSQLCPTLVASRLHNQYWQRGAGGGQWFMLGR
ncbi:hypothetical protein FB45DRAFT_1082085 [Roridomyces roridus]|uniref:Uncharacterized protein n=1 Tax=Roridomyces roridus TaxID=1738132 RepID=A0AAD7BPW2_9AGAR|nr:hypothetical protein FB45DRAFT_1082085 [Roridomyces roridus]